MSISSLVCVPLCLCLVNVVVAAPFMSGVLKQSLLKNANETVQVTIDEKLNFFEESRNSSSAGSGVPGSHEVVDLWSVMWYLGAFGGLVTFFLVVTCSEWCFGNHMYTRHGINELYINAYQSNFSAGQHRVSDTPPPPYDLFAPPSYSDLFGKAPDVRRKSKINVFIIPIHRRSSAPAS